MVRRSPRTCGECGGASSSSASASASASSSSSSSSSPSSSTNTNKTNNNNNTTNNTSTNTAPSSIFSPSPSLPTGSSATNSSQTHEISAYNPVPIRPGPSIIHRRAAESLAALRRVSEIVNSFPQASGDDANGEPLFRCPPVRERARPAKWEKFPSYTISLDTSDQDGFNSTNNGVPASSSSLAEGSGSGSGTSKGVTVSSQATGSNSRGVTTNYFRSFAQGAGSSGSGTSGKGTSGKAPATSPSQATGSSSSNGLSNRSPASGSSQTTGSSSSSSSNSSSSSYKPYVWSTAPRPATVSSASHPYHASNPSPRLTQIRSRGGTSLNPRPGPRPPPRQRPDQSTFDLGRGKDALTALSSPSPRAADLASGRGIDGLTAPSSSPRVTGVVCNNLSYDGLLAASKSPPPVDLDMSGLDGLASVATNSHLSSLDNILSVKELLETNKAPPAASVASADTFESETVISVKEEAISPNARAFNAVKAMERLGVIFGRGEFASHLNLFAQNPEDICPLCGDWREEKPACEYEGGILPAMPVRPGRHDCHAFVLGRKKAADGSWPVQHIWVYNHELCIAFEKFFEGHWYLDPTSFSAPFVPIVQRWGEYDLLIEEETDLITKSLLTSIREQIFPDVEEDLQAHRNMVQTGYIPFQHMRLAFVPGEYVICRTDDGCILCGILGDMTLIEHADTSLWRFKVNHFDWDGKRRVAGTEVYQIRFYTGTRLLEDLTVCPLTSYPDQESIEAALIERGRAFERLKEGTHSMHFNGRGRDPDSGDMHADVAESSVLIDERVIISSQYYHDNEWTYPCEMQSAETLSPRDVVAICQPRACEVGFHRCTSKTLFRGIPSSNSSSTPKDGPPDLTPWTNEECLVASHELRCFVPSLEAWYLCKLDNLSDIVWDRNAMGELMTEDVSKKLMRSALLDLSHKTEGNKNKLGRVTMLITGAPGTGKSMIVETACEETALVPYKFDLTPVVNLPNEFKRSMKKALARCKAFGIPLVIEDAHYLLAELGDGQIQSLASTIFLQMTEKFSGVILLISNQHQQLAPVVEARIDLRLHFNQLSRMSRFDIWHNKLEHHGWSEDEVNLLAACDMNGHQIDSIIKLGRLLLKEGEEWMNMDHVQQVSAARISGLIANKCESMLEDERLRNEYLERFERY